MIDQNKRSKRRRVVSVMVEKDRSLVFIETAAQTIREWELLNCPWSAVALEMTSD